MDPRNCQSQEYHLASADLSCSPSSEGWASFLKQRVFGNLLLDTDVFTVMSTNCRKRGVETDSERTVSVNTSILLQYLFLKTFYQFVLLSGQFGFMMNRVTWASLLTSLGLVNPKGSQGRVQLGGEGLPFQSQ